MIDKIIIENCEHGHRIGNCAICEQLDLLGSELSDCRNERDALRAELAEKSWRVIGDDFDNLPKPGQRVILFSDGIVRRWAYTADQYDESDRAGVYFWDCDDDQEYCPPIKPGDAWMPWPTDGPKLLEVNNG